MVKPRSVIGRKKREK